MYFWQLCMGTDYHLRPAFMQHAHASKYGSLNMPVLWGIEKTHITDDLFIPQQTHCIPQVSTVWPCSLSIGLIVN